MIAADQPNCFPAELLVAVSSREDGTMLDRTLDDRHHDSVVERRKAFCRQNDCDYDDVTYQIVTFDDQQTYDTIAEVTSTVNCGIHADALYAETPGVKLFLPVADCIATVVYDPRRRAVTSAHVGRHSSIAKLLPKVIAYMQAKGSSPEDLIIWMAPSVAKSDYRMEYFDHLDDPDWKNFADKRDDGVYLDLSGYNSALVVQAGVPAKNIHISPVNTAQNPNYFSHSQGDLHDRFAVITQLCKV